MSADPRTWIQLNFKTPGGSLLNIYAEDITALDEGLDALVDRLGRVADVERMTSATHTVNSTPASGGWGQAEVPAQRQYQPQQSAGQPAGPAPSCVHGPKTWLTGTSKGTGKPYAFWACQGPRGEQCR